MLLAAGCRPKPSPVAVADAAVAVAVAAASPAPAPAPSASSAPLPVPTTTSPVRAQVDRWNEAHDARDAKAFAALYAPKVQFYGQSLSNAECVKRKMAALAASPGYSQSIHRYMFGQAETADGDGVTRVIFTKTTVEHGKSHDYIAMLAFDRTLHIVEESDRTTERNLAAASQPWCLDDMAMPNDRVRPPFVISADKAVTELTQSKHMAELRAANPNGAYGPGASGAVSCPTSCIRSEPRRCGYDIRIEDASSSGVSNLVEWVYVDAVGNVLWYQGLRPDAGRDTWLSEPLAR